jgi:NAD(P)-dependent dehydrogenase (short-subunit alcohol dehydrogenase family)
VFGSFRAPFSAVVIGASGGVGAALVRALSASAAIDTVLACSRAGTSEASAPAGATIVPCRLDLTDEASIAAAAQRAAALSSPLRLVIVATGLLHDGPSLQPERAYRQLDPDKLARAFAINTIGPTLVAKHFLPVLSSNGRTVFAALSARVGSISDNRLGGWYGYRASKAALHMMLATLAIETAQRRPETIVVGLHPGTVDTTLSAPFQRNVPAGKLFTPDFSAAQLVRVIDGLSVADSGHVLAWDGSTIPA